MTEQVGHEDGRWPLPPLVPVPALHAVPDVTTGLAFAESVADLAVDWQQRHESDYDRLAEIVSGAVGTVPGCEYAALVVFDGDEQLVAKAVSGPETGPMIALQNELGEGPCRQTAATNEVIRAADVPNDPRWPRFSPLAAGLGIGSMLCTPLVLGRRSYGSLSMASGTRNAFDVESEALASIFATHATIALADAERLDTLHTALDTRDLIGQAKGMLMARFGLTADAAFAVLVRESKNANIKLGVVCENLCAKGSLPSGQQVFTSRS